MTERYQGFGCKELFNTLNITPNELYHCCRGQGIKQRPVISLFDGGLFALEPYLEKAIRLRDDNKRREGQCQSCLHLADGSYQAQFTGFSFVVFNHFTECNARCFYCVYGTAPIKRPLYNPLPMVRDLQKKGLLAPWVTFNIGGGEPSIHKYLPDILDFLLENDYACSFCTNALVHSKAIAGFLRRKKNSLIISLDSGTEEGFKKVKGVDLFRKAAENVLRYSETGGLVKLKYIVTPYAADEADIDGFVDPAARARAMVQISPDNRRYNRSEPKYEPDYRDHLFTFATKLYKASIQHGLKTELILLSAADADKIRGL